MFKLFGGKSAMPEEELAGCQRKKDYPGLARACYDLGVRHMDRGELGQAALWLSRADTIYSARDEIYEKMGEKLVDDCSDRIGQLEEAPLLTNEMIAWVEEQAEELSEIQIRLWGLFTLFRLGSLGARLGVLPGCEVLGGLGQAADIILRSFREEISEEEFQRLSVISRQIYELSDQDAYWGAGAEISGPDGPFQVFDLNGMLTLTELGLYLDSHLHLGETGPETGLIPCGLLSDYAFRTAGEDLRSVPRVQAELERIRDDLDFLRAGPTWEQIVQRAAQYRELDLLA